jgi:hypothetical protein
MDHFIPFQVEPRGGLKVFYTNTSFEYHRGDASLIHTDPAGARDVEHGPDVRVYHFTGTEHGTGIWPAADAQPVAADPRGWLERAQNLRGVVNYGRLLRAALVNLDRWVKDGVAPPPSAVPRLADGTLVAPLPQSGIGFPNIPGVMYTGLKSTRYLLDYGPQFDKGIMTVNPPPMQRPYFDNPANGKIYPTFVPKTDSDGNDIAGIRLPDLAVPLATYTGWSLRSAANGGPADGCEGSGQMIPLSKTTADRAAAGDPRPSIQERYGSFSRYYWYRLFAVTALVERRLLLGDDASTEFTRGLAQVINEGLLPKDDAVEY